MLSNIERKIITPNIPFGRIYQYDDVSDSIVELFTLFYGDIRAGTSYNSFSSVAENISYGEIEVLFQNKDKYNIVSNLIDTTPLAIEVFIHENYDDLSAEQFNKWYFVDYERNEKNISEKKNEMKIKAVDFIGAIEDNTICEHNVEYDFLNVDTDGNKIEPPNFNKIAFQTVEPYAIYEDLFQFNINTPVNRVKGRPHITDYSRKPKGIDFLVNTFDLIVDDFAYVTEKKSLFRIRREINQILKNQNGLQELPNLEIKLVNGLLRVYLFEKERIIVDNFINKDRIISQYREKNNRDSTEDILVESDKLDLVSANKQRTRSNMWKQKEKIESSSPDEGTEDVPNDENSTLYVSPINSKADEVLGNGTPVDKAELEMEIKNGKYFDNLDTHTIIEVKNFDEIYNGLYRVDKISCVVEQTYLSYSLETITKINN